MNNRLSKGDLPWYQANINNYVNQIDLFVLALQHYAERKMLLVVAISGWRHRYFHAGLFTLRRIRHQVVAPLNQLVTASQRIEHGQFDSPPLDTSLPNELGLLAKPLTRCRASCINCTVRWRRHRRKDPRSPRGQASSGGVVSVFAGAEHQPD